MSGPTVYMMQLGQKLPVTYQVFLQRQLSFGQVAVFVRLRGQQLAERQFVCRRAKVRW